MSMLAEPKHRIKWTLNPRGNSWAKDENNYGQRMLKKMGWEKGKGLGKNEDGSKDHIKVTYKNDKKGIGVMGNDDDWIAHQDDFNTVLSSLNEQFHSPNLSTESNESKLESLEKKSKLSRSRVHYHKFIQGKDITRYSSKDMAAIFGSRKKENEESKSKDDVVTSQDNVVELSTSSTSATYNSGQSIQEYFAQKMASLQNKEKKITDCQNTKKSKRKRKLNATLSPTEMEEENFSMSRSIHEMNDFSTEISNKDTSSTHKETSLDKETSTTSSNEMKEVSFPVKKKKKDKRKKTVVDNNDNTLSLLVCNKKKSLRLDALKQLKLYFDIFPNRQTFPLLKKYEALCENFNDTGLSTSNFLSLPGYGNKLIK